MPVAVSGCHPIAGSCSDTVCVTGIALQPEPRSFVDGQIGRPLRGSLYLLLWRLAEEESHPPDQTFWSVYGKLYQDNLIFLRGMLEQATQPDQPGKAQRNAVTQKIGDFYTACMD